MKRRKFLKILGSMPFVPLVSKVLAKEKITISPPPVKKEIQEDGLKDGSFSFSTTISSSHSIDEYEGP